MLLELGAESLGENDAALAIIDIEKTDTNSITAVRTAAETFLLKILFKTFCKETLLFKFQSGCYQFVTTFLYFIIKCFEIKEQKCRI